MNTRYSYYADTMACPFCGSKSTIIEEEEFDGCKREWVTCRRCGAMGSPRRCTHDHGMAIRAWNRRNKISGRCVDCKHFDMYPSTTYVACRCGLRYKAVRPDSSCDDWVDKGLEDES